MLNKLKSSIALLGFVSLIGFSSCTEDTTTTPDNSSPTIGKAFITTTGSYWIYQNQVLDTNGIIVTALGSTFDSTFVKSNYSLDGKQATELATFTIDAPGVPATGEASIEIYAKEGEKVYVNTTNLLSDMGEGLPFDIGDISNIDKWLVLLQDASNWDILTFPINVPNFNFVDGLPVTLQLAGNLTLKGKKVGEEDITINGTKYRAAKYTTISSVVAEIQLGEDFILIGRKGTQLATLTSPTETSIWIVNGIGIVKTDTKPFTTKLSIVPSFKALVSTFGITDSETKNGGDVSTLIRYNVK